MDSAYQVLQTFILGPVFLQSTNLPEVVDDGEGHEEGVVGSPGDEAAHPHHQVQSTLKN